MKLVTKLLIAAGALSISATGFAAQPASFGPGTQGFYAGADAGFGSTSCDKCSATSTGTGSTSNSGFAGTIFGGYQLNSYLAVEAGWGVLPGVKSSYSISAIPPFIPAQSGSATASATHFYGAVKGMYPVNTQWGVFGKVGYDYASVSSSTFGNTTTYSYNPSGVLLAAGASYTINTNLAVTASYNQILASATKSGATQSFSVGYGTVGLTYSF